MKVLHLNQSDILGGAAIAGYRLHKALLENQICSRLIVGKKLTEDDSVAELPPGSLLERANVFVKRQVIPAYTLSSRGRRIINHVWFKEADVVHVHNIHTGTFCGLSTLTKIGQLKPVVTTLHDMWHFTGHCSYSYACEHWKAGCGKCPDLSIYPAIRWDSSRFELSWKKRVLQQTNTCIVSPSKWLARLASQSIYSSQSITVIPYAIDLKTFSPEETESGDIAFNVSPGKIVLLVCSVDIRDERKGLACLVEAFERLSALERSKFALVCLGNGAPVAVEGLEVLSTGYISNETKLAGLYRRADYLVMTSKADNLPLVVLESLACGLPVVGFAVGGVPDVVRDGFNGFLTDDFSGGGLQKLLEVVLEQGKSRNLREFARKSAENSFSSLIVSSEHVKVYEQAIEQYGRR